MIRYVTHVPRGVRRVASYSIGDSKLTVFRNGRAYYALLDVGNPLYNLIMKAEADELRKALSLFFEEIFGGR